MERSTGRPSIPPERWLKSEWVIALFALRGHRLFCEEITSTMLYRWFRGMSLDDLGGAHSTFSQNHERRLRHEVAQRFFDAGGTIRTPRGAALG